MTVEDHKAPDPSCYDKPVWTLGALTRELPHLPGHLARVAPSYVGLGLGGAFRERIMLAVAAENRCRYCQAAHSAFGEMSGLSPHEIHAILENQEDEDLSSDQRLALAYARDLARRGFASHHAGLRGQLVAHFGEAGVAAIEATARVMNLANRFGNTFDAMLERVRGRCERSGAAWLDLAVISPVFLVGAATMTPVVVAAGLLGTLRGRRS